MWRQDRGDYGWLDPNNAALRPLLQDFEPADLEERLNAANVDAAVIVQAAPTLDETFFLMFLAQNSPFIAGVVGWVDLTDVTSLAQLDWLVQEPLFKGVRPMLQDLDRTDWIVTEPNDQVLAKLVELGLRFDALVLAQHLPHLLSFAKAHPDLAIVVDHAAKPALAAPSDLTDWRAGLKAIAEQTSAYCKLSGLLTEMAPDDLDRAGEVLAPIVADLLEWFGPERLMWGSDWPVLRLAGSYAGWDGLAQQLLGDLSDTDRARILGGTAAEFYGLEVAE